MLDMYGTALHDGVSPPDPAELFGDGQNIYAYAVASPTQHRDPSGLVIGFLVPGPSDFITGALEGLVNEYAANLEWDLDWAMDWSQGDDWHTRSDNNWMNWAMMQGVYDAYWTGIPGTDIGFNPLDVFAGRRSPGIESPGIGRKGGTRTLRKLGLVGVSLKGKSFAVGRRDLLAAGFIHIGRTGTGRQRFEHPTKGTMVDFDRGDALVGKQRPHWHIRDSGGNNYDAYGRPSDNMPRRHIPAR
ncbi:MAG: hypothetical protein RIB58_01260 [Phycisphaerales bacterium]